MAARPHAATPELPGVFVSCVVWIDRTARLLIEQEACRRQTVESGGALLGWADGDDVVVACAYGPGPRARHRRTTFEPHPATTDQVITAVHEASQGRCRYLGSWHSHPGGRARPSGTDLATTAAVADEPEVRLPDPLVLIQATQLDGGGQAVLGELRVWRWNPRADWLLPAELETIDVEAPACPTVVVPAGWGRGDRELLPRTV